MAINERQRMEYLEAMGIDTYMPRLVLPNAPEVFRVQAPEMDRELAANEPVVSWVDQLLPVGSGGVDTVETVDKPDTLISADSVASAGSGAADGKALQKASEDALASIREKPSIKASSVKSEKPVVEKAVDVQPAIEPFSLSCWSVPGDVLVVDSRHPEQALPTEQLLVNIVVALGYPRFQLPEAEVVRWPLMNHRLVDRDEHSARTTVQFTVEGFLRKYGLKKLLLLGAEAAYFVLSPEPDSPASMESYFTLASQNTDQSILLPGDYSARVVVAHSLGDMLLNPHLKADTWRALIPYQNTRS